MSTCLEYGRCHAEREGEVKKIILLGILVLIVLVVCDVNDVPVPPDANYWVSVGVVNQNYKRDFRGYALDFEIKENTLIITKLDGTLRIVGLDGKVADIIPLEGK